MGEIMVCVQGCLNGKKNRIFWGKNACYAEKQSLCKKEFHKNTSILQNPLHIKKRIERLYIGCFVSLVHTKLFFRTFFRILFSQFFCGFSEKSRLITNFWRLTTLANFTLYCNVLWK